MTQSICGIDPGLDGAIVRLRNGHLDFYPMPTFKLEVPLPKSKIKKAKNGKPAVTHKFERHIDVIALRKIFDEIDIKDCKVIIEDVVAFFGMGSGALFKMGYSIGMIHCLLDIMTEQYELIRPKRWQEKVWINEDIVRREKDKIKKTTKQGSVDTKATSLNAALRLYPRVNFCIGKRKIPSDGIVDATLLAHIGSL